MDQDYEKMLQGAACFTESEQQILGDVFQTFSEQVQKLKSEVQQTVREEMAEKPRDNEAWKITAGVVRDTPDLDHDLRGAGLCRMTAYGTPSWEKRTHEQRMAIDLQSDPWTAPRWNAGTAFLNCRYDEIDSITGRTYEAILTLQTGEQYTVPYRLVRTDWLLRHEELLMRTAAQYGLTRPPVYAPMSRRAVYVEADLSNISALPAPGTIDFQYERNGIKDVVLEGRTPVWNVHIDKESPPLRETTELATPFGDVVSGIYEINAPDSNLFICSEGEGWDAKRHLGKLYVSIGPRDLNEVSLLQMTIKDVPRDYVTQEPYLFENLFDSQMPLTRIRTEADARYALHAFTSAGLELADISVTPSPKRKSVDTYEDRFAYYRGQRKSFQRAGTTRCWLQFQRPAHDRYFEDLVSYATAHMNHFYPEFHWVGAE